MATDSTYEQRIIDVDGIDKSSGDAIICGLQAESVLLRREEVAIPTVTRHQLLILYTARPISYETHDQIILPVLHRTKKRRSRRYVIIDITARTDPISHRQPQLCHENIIDNVGVRFDKRSRERSS